jgi:hypothetical protein
MMLLALSKMESTVGGEDLSLPEDKDRQTCRSFIHYTCTRTMQYRRARERGLVLHRAWVAGKIPTSEACPFWMSGLWPTGLASPTTIMPVMI